ncbi:hypothetical protein FLAG1_02540 [Fusarium langsethiae]|uniref:Uncharacterized protein n=1 Tax=Fusarium langsethiae TaxID=179993 RepID=A0A0M9F2C0_FUSLA|nr:hypothetical protein FLAG1_02540 [Fusarium langsethiae]
MDDWNEVWLWDTLSLVLHNLHHDPIPAANEIRVHRAGEITRCLSEKREEIDCEASPGIVCDGHDYGKSFIGIFKNVP